MLSLHFAFAHDVHLFVTPIKTARDGHIYIYQRIFMFINISNTISVSKHLGQQQNNWICYEPLEGNDQRKKPLWKRQTGLMSASAMHSWLTSQYNDQNAVNAFRNISGM